MSDDAVEPEATGLIDPNAIVKEARETSSLIDIFPSQGERGYLPTMKSLVIRDLDALNEFATRRSTLTVLQQAVAEGERPKRPTPEQRATFKAMDAQIAEAEARVEEAKEKMLSTALSFHLRAYPNIARKVAIREARKIFLNPDTGQLHPEFYWEEMQEWIDLRLFGETVQKVVQSDGTEIDFGVPKAELGEYLSNNMPPVSWARLEDDYKKLTLRQGIGQAAIEDPGF